MHYEEGEKDAVSVGGEGDASEPYASARTARRCTSKRQWSQLGRLGYIELSGVCCL